MAAKVLLIGPLAIAVGEDGEAWIPGPAGRSWRRARDRWCYYCGEAVRYGTEAENQPDQKTRDHVTPKCQGGKGGPDNIVPACRACNGAKDKIDALTFLLLKPYGKKAPFKSLTDGLTSAERKARKKRERRRRKAIMNHRKWFLHTMKTRIEDLIK